MKNLNIGIIGPCNPYELRNFITNANEILMCNGAATAPTTYIKELISSGYRVTVFSFYPSSDNKTICYKGQNFEIFMVASSSRTRGFGMPFRLRRIINIVKIHMRNIDVLHAQWTYEYALVAKLFTKQIPVFCTVRDWCPYIMSLAKGVSNKLLWAINYIMFYAVMNDKKIHFIANSNYTYDRIKINYPDKVVELIPNPINKEHVLISRKNILNNKKFISIAQSLDDPRKNIIQLLRAFASYRKENPDAQLMLVGNHNEKSDLSRTANKEQLLENVTFLGVVNHENIFDLIDECVCLVHPALEETFGNILLEAMARHIVCIGGDLSGAVPQVLDYGRCGILCDINNPKSIEHAMEKSLDLDYTSVLKDNALCKINELYRSDVNMLKTIEVYRKYIYQ